MKLLFIWFDIDSGHKPGPNLGLAWLSSFLKSKGHDIACLHIRDENRVETIGDEIEAHQSDCIGLSLVSNQMHYLKNFTPAIRALSGHTKMFWGLHVDRRFIDTITFRMLMIAPSIFV